MRNLRFNIANLLVAVVVVAVGLAALRGADDLWDSVLFSLTLGLLLASVLLAAHGTEARRAFWIGFALFGWGYLILSLVPSTEPRLITAKALAYLDSRRVEILDGRANAMRIIPDPERMRAYNLSPDDIRKALTPSSVLGSPGRHDPAMIRTPQATEYILWSGPYNNVNQYNNIILKATPDGEILRVKDVARVAPGPWAGTTEDFLRAGHSLLALLAGWLGGMLSRGLRRHSAGPGDPAGERAAV